MSDYLQSILHENYRGKADLIYESSSIRRLLSLYKFGLLFIPIGAFIFFFQHRFFYSTPNDLQIYIFMILVGAFFFILYKLTILKPYFAENIGRIFIYSSVFYIWIFTYLKLFDSSNLEIDIVSPPIFIIIIMLVCSLIYGYKDLTLLTSISLANFSLFSLIYLMGRPIWVLNNFVFILIFYFLFLLTIYYKNLTEKQLMKITLEAEEKRNSVIELTKNNIKLNNSISHEFLTPIHNIQANIEQFESIPGLNQILITDLKSIVESFKFWIYYLIDFNNFNNFFVVNNEIITIYDLATDLKTILLNNTNFINDTEILVFIDSGNQTLSVDKIRVFLIIIDTIYFLSKNEKKDTITINITVDTSDRDQFLQIMISQKASNQKILNLTQDKGNLDFRMSKNLAKQMNGMLSFEFTSDFLMYFINIPLINIKSDKKDVLFFDRMKKDNLNVLVVDDLEDNRIIIKEFLKEYPLEITEASNGLEALDLLYGKKFDLILMDIRMPKLDGISATRDYRAYEKKIGSERIPIIFLTAYLNDLIDSDELQELVDNRILNKPFRKENLIKILSDLT